MLFDRDGTLVHDVPYNGDPARVCPVESARPALRTLRRLGLRTGVVTNQSGLATGKLTPEQVARVNRRVDDLLGPFDVWEVCPHAPNDGCGCRKPAPGMVLRAAERLDVEVCQVAVIGDIGADVDAAAAAGAWGLLVPTARTQPAEVRRAALVATDLVEAVDLAIDRIVHHAGRAAR